MDISPNPFNSIEALTRKVEALERAAWDKPLACRAYSSVNGTVLSVTAATWTGGVPFNAEEFDNNSIHDTATNNSRLTLNKVGVWEVGFNVLWLASAGYAAGCDIYGRVVKNAATSEFLVGGNAIAATGSTIQPVTNGSGLVKVAAITDYVELQVYSDTGTSVIGTGDKSFNNFWCRYVGPAT